MYRLSPIGLIEHLDPETGVVTPIEKPLGNGQALHLLAQAETLDMFLENNIKYYDTSGTPHWVNKNSDIAAFATKYGFKQDYPYSPLVALEICDQLRNGKTITDICKSKAMPPYDVVAKWRRKNKDFAKQYQEALEDRAEIFFDKAIEVVENATADEDEIALARLQTDTYQKVAKVGNQHGFGDKQHIKTESTTTIIVETGIRRPGDQGFEESREVLDIDVLFKTIEDTNDK